MAKRVSSRGKTECERNKKAMKVSDIKTFSFGVLLVIALAVLATLLAQLEWVQELRLSPLIVGIVIGMLFANTIRKWVPSGWGTGIIFCSKQILRTGIVLFGFKITLTDVLAVGLPAMVIDVVVVSLTMIFGVLLGRLLNMDSQTAILTSVGSSICGAAAVLGAEPVVKAEPHKTAIAVSTVVIFGTLAMFLYPALQRAGVFDMDTRQVGIYTGATLHEVAHVYGAGEAMDAAAAAPLCANSPANQSGDIRGNAVIVKMIRVILLAPVLIILAVLLSRKDKRKEKERQKISIPVFAFLFLAVIGFNSLQVLPDSVVSGILTADSFMLTMAMTALGAETSFDKFRKAGAKPFLLALLLFIWLIFGGYWLVKGVTAVL